LNQPNSYRVTIVNMSAAAASPPIQLSKKETAKLVEKVFAHTKSFKEADITLDILTQILFDIKQIKGATNNQIIEYLESTLDKLGPIDKATMLDWSQALATISSKKSINKNSLTANDIFTFLNSFLSLSNLSLSCLIHTLPAAVNTNLSFLELASIYSNLNEKATHTSKEKTLVGLDKLFKCLRFSTKTASSFIATIIDTTHKDNLAVALNIAADLLRRGASTSDILTLFETISFDARKNPREDTGEIFKALPAAVQALSDKKLATSRMCGLISRIITERGIQAPSILLNLPVVMEKVETDFLKLDAPHHAMVETNLIKLLIDSIRTR